MKAKDNPPIKTKLLKKLTKRARKRYQFEETYTRDQQNQSIPFYKVIDNEYDDYYSVIEETSNRERAWKLYKTKCRELIFKELDGYYKFYNKNPKSIRLQQSQEPVSVLSDSTKPADGKEESRQPRNKIKI